MTLARRQDEARIALMLLTRLPVGRIAGEAPGLSAAAWAYPLVGLPVGLLVWAVHAGALALGLGAAPAAVLALAAAAVVTGALHHDGLADMADGIGGGGDRARRLAIMRDSRIGSYGALALGLVLAAQGTAIVEAGPGLAAFLTLAVGSRWLMLWALVALPPARPDGLGAAAGTRAGALVPGAVLSLVLFAALGLAGLVLALAMTAAAVLVARRARATLGGQTGDVLGAVQMLAETAGWLALAALR